MCTVDCIDLGMHLTLNVNLVDEQSMPKSMPSLARAALHAFGSARWPPLRNCAAMAAKGTSA